MFDEYQAWLGQYSKYTEMLPTRSFLAPLDEDEEIEVELAKGNAVSIKFKALSELQPSGMRCGTGQRLQHPAILPSDHHERGFFYDLVRVTVVGLMGYDVWYIKSINILSAAMLGIEKLSQARRHIRDWPQALAGALPHAQAPAPPPAAAWAAGWCLFGVTSMPRMVAVLHCSEHHM